MTGYWRLRAVLAEDAVAPASTLLEGEALSVSAFESGRDWMVEAVFRGRPDRDRIETGLALATASAGAAPAMLELAPLPQEDWLAQVYAGWPPRRIGRFYLYGSHNEPPPRDGSVPLLIDAGTAFGSGEHATTQGCLKAIERLAKAGQPRRILDMGCGSGVLGIAAAKVWHRPVIAIDIDPESARVARVNAHLNGVAAWVRTAAGNGFGTPLARRGGPYDLVLANILARPLIRMAPALAASLAPGAAIVLSGLLARQARSVTAAYRAQGLALAARIPIEDWQTLIFRRRS